AAEWLLRHWKYDKTVEFADAELSSTEPDKRQEWHVSSHGQTFTRIAGPAEFLMGSPPHESYRQVRETLHHQRIPRSFAIASKETTIAQFQEFLRSHPEIKHTLLKGYTSHPQGPIVSVTWFEALQYCRWLSEREGIPEEHMCYPPIADIK